MSLISGSWKRKGLYRSASLYNCSGDMMSETMIDRGDAFIASLDLRVSEILDRCTRCARCVEVCPTAGPAGIDTREPAAVVDDVLDILRGGGDATSRGARWAQSCTGSGRCLSACDDGVIPYRAGDAKASGRIGGNTVAGFAGTGASRVLTWCPTCNIQLSEIVMPSTEAAFALQHVIPYIAARIELLRRHFIHPVHKRVALHEHPVVAGVTEGVTQILAA